MLDYHLAQIRFNQTSGSVVLLDHLQKRIDRTYNRYWKAIKTLATVRKMGLPTLIDLRADTRIRVTNETNCDANAKKRLIAG